MREIPLIIPVLALALLLSPGGTAQGEFYKWVDDQGVVHFSDTPPPAGKKAEVREDKVYPAQSPAPSAPPDPSPEVSVPVPSRPGVVLYTTSWCRVCKVAKSWFAARGIPYKEFDVEKSQGGDRRYREMTRTTGVPLVVINGRTFAGFSEKAYMDMLRASP